MKTAIRLITFMLTIGLMTSCTSKPVKTIENLKAAYNGESTASAKYAEYAAKALTENYDTVAVMFQAISNAEAVHAANHLKVLEKLGEKIDGPKLGTFNVRSTAENLIEAIKGEIYEFETMYPGFIATAEKEKCADAVKSFTWALDTEKKHQGFFKVAQAGLLSGGENGLPGHWFVCPVCGNTYSLETVVSKCDFCMTPKEKFIAF